MSNQQQPRRHFLQTAAAGLAAAGVASRAEGGLEVCRADDFEQQLKSTFQVEGAGRLTLEESKRLPNPADRNRPRNIRPEAFSLLFQLSDGTAPTNDTHMVCHPRMGRMCLFLHQVERDADGVWYEAVFN